MLTQEERAHKRSRGDSWFKLLMRLGQKNTSWIKNIVHTFNNPGNLVVHAFAGTSSVSMNCMLLPKHRRVLGLEVYPGCMTEAMPQLVLLYAWHALSTKSDIDGEEKLLSSCKIHLITEGAIKVQTLLDVLKVLEGLPVTCTLLGHIPYHLNTYFGEGEIFQKAKNISANQWSGNWLARLRMYDVCLLLAVGCGSAGNFIKKSAIPRKYAQRGVLAGRPIRAG